MNPRKYRDRNILPFISLGKGILIGLVFFIPGVILITYGQEINRLWNEISNMPVITNLSRDFESGFEIAGELFRNRSANFYQVEHTSSIIDEDGNRRIISPDSTSTSAPFAWRRDSIYAKLVQVFSPKMMGQVNAYLDYIEEYNNLACREMAYSRIPASISLAQGLLESNAGRSYLARNANNHFGIKCMPKKNFRKNNDNDFIHHSLSFDCVNRKDDYKWDRFEMYRSPELSYRRHTILLAENKRYNWMLEKYFTGESYKVAKKWFGVEEVPYYAAWSIGLKTGGYATNRKYAQKLAYIIETYELWRVDYTIIFDGYTEESDYALD